MTTYPQDFLAAMKVMLPHESPFPNDWTNPHNFSNDAHDPGGMTMDGIIQREYDLYRRRQGKPTQNVRFISQDEGYDIYWNDYYAPHCRALPSGLNVSFFDMCVNAGEHGAVKVLQHALGDLYTGAYDGLWGPKTQAGVNAITPANLETMIRNYAHWREAYYRSLSGFQFFSHSWLSRTADTLSKSLAMAKGATFPRPTVETQTTVKPMDNPTNNPIPAVNSKDILGEIETALGTANNVLPQIIGFLSSFIPQLKPVIPFLNLLPGLINAVKSVHMAQQAQAPATSPAAPSFGGLISALSAVEQHLTPGQPNSPVLGPSQTTAG